MTTAPVTVVTGFLDSGKTTLIGRLLRDPRLVNTPVIVNEFGEVGLDHVSTLDPSHLTLIGVAQSPNANDEQVINLGGLTDNFLVISSDNLNVAAGNVLLESVIFGTPDAVPEPATTALLGSGLIGIFLIRRRRNV